MYVKCYCDRFIGSPTSGAPHEEGNVRARFFATGKSNGLDCFCKRWKTGTGRGIRGHQLVSNRLLCVDCKKKKILCAQFHAKLPTLTLAQLQVNSSYRMSLLLLSPFMLCMLIFVVFKMYLFIPSYWYYWFKLDTSRAHKDLFPPVWQRKSFRIATRSPKYNFNFLFF
jgi:hypothetical protein